MKDSQSVKKRVKQKKPRKFKNIKKKDRSLEVIKPAEAINSINKSNTFSFLNFFKKHLIPLVFIIPIIIYSIFLYFYYLNIQLGKEISENALKELSFKVEMSEFPILETNQYPDITAESAVIYDIDSDVVIFSKNSDVRFSLASTTKIMTALVGFEYLHPESILTIFTPHVEGSNIGFLKGQQFTFEDLLYAMFLPSSNEAAYAIAQNYPEGVEAFVDRMNIKAREMNLNNTHFNDPIGLDDDSNYSTVLDLARLASQAVNNKNIVEISSMKNKTITDVAGLNKYWLINRNELVGKDGVLGLKTGTTAGAGQVLVTLKKANGHSYIIIVMKSNQRFYDTELLLSLLDNVRYIKPEYK